MAEEGRATPLTLRAALDLYEATYMPARNFAPRSRIEYDHDLTQLVTFMERAGVTHVDALSLKHVDAYQAELDRLGFAGSTRRRKTASARSFLRFLARNGYLRQDLGAQLIPPQAETKEPRVLSEAEYKRLLDVVRYETRDATVIELLLQTGLRLTELIRLTLDDVQLPTKITPDPENVGLLYVRAGKGRKDRTLPLNCKACKAIRAYLRVRPDVEIRTLFVNKFRGPLGPRGVQKLVAKYLAAANIQGASVHSLRHTFGTHHVARGTSLRTVQAALGHQDLKTTSIYVALAKEVMTKELQEHAL